LQRLPGPDAVRDASPPHVARYGDAGAASGCAVVSGEQSRGAQQLPSAMVDGEARSRGRECLQARALLLANQTFGCRCSSRDGQGHEGLRLCDGAALLTDQVITTLEPGRQPRSARSQVAKAARCACQQQGSLHMHIT
jgi:hypothetical protein